MRMRMRVLARKLGRTKARLSKKLSKRRESMASKTTENMDQAKEINGITVPNSLGRQLPTWSQTDDSASTTLKILPVKVPKLNKLCLSYVRPDLNLPWSRDDTSKIQPGHEDNREGAASHSVEHLHLFPQEMEHFLQIN